MRFRPTSSVLLHLGVDAKGASLVEYGIALAVITAVGVAAIDSLGNTSEAKINTACNTVVAANACP